MKLADLITKKVHIIGINGIGMSALAIYLKKNKIEISGSDIAKNSITDNLKKNGISVIIGHKESNVKNKDIIFYSSAIKDNPEIRAAKKNKIPYFNRSKLLQIICKDKFTIVVSGSHGKTSTTSLLGHLLVSSGLNPTIISGGIMKNFGQNIYLTDSNYVVVEADESDGTIFKLKPSYLIYLNVDKEHLDYYKSFSTLKKKIKNFILKTAEKSKVIINNDDEFLNTLKSYSPNIITFGKKNKSIYSFRNIKLTYNRSIFDLYKNNKIIQKEISSPLVGEHNIQNLTSALVVMKDLDIKINIKNIMAFKGTLRRLNILGSINKSIFIDDYAHHPTEIQKLIDVSNLYKNNQIYLIIEPHRYSRLNDLYKEYLQTLKNINNLNILRTYSAGEVFTKKMKNSKNLVNDLNVLYSQQTGYLDTYADLFNLLDNLTSNNKKKIIIAAGAGSISNQFRLYYDSKKK
tara:strand:- start:1045 stop:2424 length:1380 start_codon:yes stop_codon:yes gene_type:complete